MLTVILIQARHVTCIVTRILIPLGGLSQLANGPSSKAQSWLRIGGSSDSWSSHATYVPNWKLKDCRWKCMKQKRHKCLQDPIYLFNTGVY